MPARDQPLPSAPLGHRPERLPEGGSPGSPDRAGRRCEGDEVDLDKLLVYSIGHVQRTPRSAPMRSRSTSRARRPAASCSRSTYGFRQAAVRRPSTATRRRRSTASTAASWRSTSRTTRATSPASGAAGRRRPHPRRSRAHGAQRIRRGRVRTSSSRPGRSSSASPGPRRRRRAGPEDVLALAPNATASNAERRRVPALAVQRSERCTTRTATRAGRRVRRGRGSRGPTRCDRSTGTRADPQGEVRRGEGDRRVAQRAGERADTQQRRSRCAADLLLAGQAPDRARGDRVGAVDAALEAHWDQFRLPAW